MSLRSAGQREVNNKRKRGNNSSNLVHVSVKKSHFLEGLSKVLKVIKIINMLGDCPCSLCTFIKLLGPILAELRDLVRLASIGPVFIFAIALRSLVIDSRNDSGCVLRCACWLSSSQICRLIACRKVDLSRHPGSDRGYPSSLAHFQKVFVGIGPLAFCLGNRNCWWGDHRASYDTIILPHWALHADSYWPSELVLFFSMVLFNRWVTPLNGESWQERSNECGNRGYLFAGLLVGDLRSLFS